MKEDDKELLVLAAKAEGHSVEFDEASGLAFYDNRFTGLLWNPLHNDGDALRLAVHRYIDIKEAVYQHCEFNICDYDDRCAATRRAIVCAAAEIAKALGGT